MWRDRLNDEGGVALIYVLFATMVISGLVVVFMSRVLFETRSTAQARDHEAAIHVAEAGAESLLAAINNEGEEFANKVVTMDPSGAPLVLADDQTQAEEEDWAIARADADWEYAEENASYDTQVVEAEGGHAYAIRPKKPDVEEAADVLFGVGFVPGIDAPDRTVRVVKMRITRHFFKPDNALLTGSGLKFGGNAAVLAPGCDADEPETCNADVHANGDIDVSGSSHEVQGDFTSSGTITGSAQSTGGTVASGEEEVEVPSVRARNFYHRDVTLNSDPGGDPVSWYDLCSDGTVRARSTNPCTGEVLWPEDGDNSTRYRGWRYRSNNNTWEGDKVHPGVFYVHHADASVNGSADPPGGCPAGQRCPRAVSIFVDGEGGAVDATGSLEAAGNPSFVSAYPDVMFIADRDLDLKGTAGGGQTECDPDTHEDGECPDVQNYDGFIFAGEQVDVSGTVDLRGAMIAEDSEDKHGLVTHDNVIRGTMTLTYSDDLTLNLSGRVTIEFWNEL